ncbi:MAG: hypothetical protein Q8930_10705 [Bacillota bacterium]|nr:hypothetical protein [Bacillota bacterium]
MINNNKDKHLYEDIINLKHHVSIHHEHMSALDRAAQFSPFAALTGFDGAIKETARLTDVRIELDADARALLNEKFRIVQEQLNSQQELEFTFFRPDEWKDGGAYITARGTVKKIDENEHIVILQDGTWIPMEDIVDITGGIFQAVEDFI